MWYLPEDGTICVHHLKMTHIMGKWNDQVTSLHVMNIKMAAGDSAYLPLPTVPYMLIELLYVDSSRSGEVSPRSVSYLGLHCSTSWLPAMNRCLNAFAHVPSGHLTLELQDIGVVIQWFVPGGAAARLMMSTTMVMTTLMTTTTLMTMPSVGENLFRMSCMQVG